MKKKNFMPIIITSLLFLMCFSFAIASWTEFGNFSGSGHNAGSCHFNNEFIGSGSVTFSSSSGSTVDPNEVFTLTVQVNGFTEASGTGIRLGFASGTPGRGNNTLFSFNATDVAFTPDGSGNGNVDFQVTAPASTNNYDLIADVIMRSGGQNTYWITGTWALTVQLTDNTPPSVSITAPINDSWVKGSSISISGTATDLGSDVLGSSVEAYLTNTTGTNNTIPLSYTGPGYSGTWDSTSIFDGDYNITVRAQDNYGNTNVTEYVTIKVDNTAPSIVIDNVIPDPSNGITTITASNSSSDIDGNGIRVSITDPSSREIYVNLNYQGSNLWNGTFTVTQNGNYDVNINATDYAGNTGYDGPASISGDVETPIISIVSVLPNPSNGVATIRASNSSADIDVNGIWATVTTPSFQSIHTKLTYQGGNIWNETFTVVENGIYSVNINATDNANNTGFAGPVDITGDITAPQVNIENPTNDGDQIGGSIISISGKAFGTGSNIVSIYINESDIWVIDVDPTGLPNGDFSFNNFSEVPVGFYWVAINITDQAGNVNVSYRYFEVVDFDIFPPILIVTSINPNPSNGYTEITVTSNEDLLSAPLLNITAPNTSVFYPPMMSIGIRTWRANYTVDDNGTYTVQINGTDLDSNVGYKSTTFTGDVVAPTITIESILPNPSNGLVIITASNSSNDINGNGIWATVTTPSFQSIFVELNYQGGNTWNGTFTVTENGDYTVNLNATDYANNTGYAGPLGITGDLVPPSISIFNALPNPSDGLVIITATNSSNDIDGNGIWATISTPSFQSIYVELNYQGGNIWNGTFTVFESGLYTININATDIAGNIGYGGPLNINGDVSSPVININSPQQDDLFGINTPSFNITITEPNLDSTWYTLYNGTSWSNNQSFSGSIGTLEAFLWDPMPNGVITIRFYANDTFGKVGSSQVNITKDIINPIINIISPVEDQVFGSDTPEFDINVVELHPQSTWYSLFDGTTWSNNISFAGLIGTIEESLWNSMPNGNITIRFYANDTLGNTGYRDVSVTKSTSPPDQNGGVDDGNDIFNITLVIVIIGSILALLILILRGSRTKRFIQ